MRVLILIKGLGRGGAEQLLVNASRYADKSAFGYEVAYVLPWKDALVADLEKVGLAVHCLDGPNGLGWLQRLRGLVRDGRFDLVHCHLPFTAIGARLALRSLGGVRLVYTEHNTWGRYRAPTYWGNLLTFNLNDYVFTVSEDVRASIRYPPAAVTRRRPPVETLYHGPDPAALERTRSPEEVRSELGIPADAPVIGTVANFKAHKGHGYLIEAARKVADRVDDMRWVLVGLGPLEKEIRARAEQAGLGRNIIFTGMRDDVADVVSTFDVFAMSSLHEGLSIALIEAMALARPVVVTRVGGLPEVVDDGINGFIVPPRDPGALAARIVEVLGDAPLRTRLGTAARAKATSFDIRRAVRRMEQVYREVAA